VVVNVGSGTGSFGRVHDPARLESRLVEIPYTASKAALLRASAAVTSATGFSFGRTASLLTSTSRWPCSRSTSARAC
jgi:hypothetical protein